MFVAPALQHYRKTQYSVCEESDMALAKIWSTTDIAILVCKEVRALSGL